MLTDQTRKESGAARPIPRPPVHRPPRRPPLPLPLLVAIVTALVAGGLAARDRAPAPTAVGPVAVSQPVDAGFLGTAEPLDPVGEAVVAPEAAAVAPAPAPEPAATPAVVPPDPPAPDTSGRGAPAVSRPPPRPNRAGSRAPSAPTGGNGVHPADFPDPFVLDAGGVFYAFATQSGLTQVPVLRSLDLESWEPAGDALQQLPAWATWGYVWAPSVLARPAGYVLYYTTRHSSTGLQCLSRAVSVLPEGPYVDASAGPIVCQTDRGGSIDPSPFVDADGTPWLLWKSEGTLHGEPTRLWSQRLSDDGLGLVGPGPSELLRTEDPWEGPIIEGPALVLDGGRYHLLFSGNRWETAAYGVGHAVCAGPAGPCHRVERAPVLRTGVAEAGPGSPEVFRDRTGALVLAYHAWTPPHVGYPAGARRLHLASVRFDGDRALVVAPRRKLAA